MRILTSNGRKATELYELVDDEYLLVVSMGHMMYLEDIRAKLELVSV